MKRGRRPSNIPKEQIKAEKLYLQGFKEKNIASTIGVSLMTICRWAKQSDWELAYKQKYEMKLNKIKDSIERLVFLGSHRPPKDKKIPGNC